MKILSCIPKQRHTTEDKLAWVDQMCQEHKPDLFVTPQEYFGGIQTVFFESGEPMVFEEPDVIDPMIALSKKHDVGIMFGALIKDRQRGQVRERIYGVDPSDGLTGWVDKMMLPAYDHIDAKGAARVSPEDNFEHRAVTIPVKGANIGVLFCWEVYSNYIWHALARANPDFLVSMIKFGVAGWPQKAKDPETGNSIVKGFGFGGDGGWIDRLRFAARYDIAAPIVNSTNSWDLPKRSRPLAGTIFPFGEREDTLYHPKKGERGIIEETVVIDEFDPLEYRLNRVNKHNFFQQLGRWPTSQVRNYTMMWKVKRMERKFAGIKDNAPAEFKAPEIKDDVQQDLFD